MIRNIHYLFTSDDDPQINAIDQRKGFVSQHIVQDEQFKFVFGWDQPLQSFYLQKYDPTREEDDRIIVWLGATVDTTMYEVEDLVRMARKHGLRIDYSTRVKLYGERDHGSRGIEPADRSRGGFRDLPQWNTQRRRWTRLCRRPVQSGLRYSRRKHRRNLSRRNSLQRCGTELCRWPIFTGSLIWHRVSGIEQWRQQQFHGQPQLREWRQ